MDLLKKYRENNFKNYFVFYKKNAEKYNVVLFGILLLLNFFDIILTVVGVNLMGAFKEGNPCVQEAVNTGNFFPALLIKGIFISVVWFGVMFRKGRQHIAYSAIITGYLIFDIIFYLLIVLEWALKILQYRMFA